MRLTLTDSDDLPTIVLEMYVLTDSDDLPTIVLEMYVFTAYVSQYTDHARIITSPTVDFSFEFCCMLLCDLQKYNISLRIHCMCYL
jgi:hypothetical protein